MLEPYYFSNDLSKSKNLENIASTCANVASNDDTNLILYICQQQFSQIHQQKINLPNQVQWLTV